MPSGEQPGGGGALAKEAQEPLLDETSLLKAQHCGETHVVSMLLPCPDSSVMVFGVEMGPRPVSSIEMSSLQNGIA